MNEKFERLCHEAIEADEQDIIVAIARTAIERLHECSPRHAETIVEQYEGMLHYNNFLTEEEADTIVSKLENADGSHGPRWKDKADFFQRTEQLGGTKEKTPAYNKWALYTEVNIISSDHYNVLSKWANGNREKYLEMCLELATSQLTDRDHPSWIRWYVGLEHSL